MNIIYGEVKAGEKVDIFEFMRIIGDMKKKGATPLYSAAPSFR